jgi:hypothetical protein
VSFRGFRVPEPLADKELYQRQITATDRRVDALVYELRPKGVPEANAERDMG